MTQQPLPLDQFSHVRIVVDFDAQQKAYRHRSGERRLRRAPCTDGLCVKR